LFNQDFAILVEAQDERSARREARSLADTLREISGVLEIGRRKDEGSTMDLGAIVTVVATSGATVAMARGIADWLRRRHGTRLKIQLDARSGSIKAEVDNINPAAAVRIVELIRGE
jgi:plasmid stabilization system protein ParE